MKLTVFGATGGLGTRVWKRALEAGHSVVAFVRTPSKLDRSDPKHASLEVFTGDVMDASAVTTATEGCDVVVNCTSPAGGNSTLEMARSIVNHGSNAGVRSFYMVGGIGALWVPGTERRLLVQDWDDPAGMRAHGIARPMPKDAIRSMTKGHLASMEFMATTGVEHTFICPGLMLDGSASPTRRVTLDELGGASVAQITYDDVAATIVEDLNIARLFGHRVCVS
ncbi:MAG: NAD(P)H-binding protein, partial [Myxococcota bacterium]